MKDGLDAFGWGAWQEDALREHAASEGQVPARVVRQERGPIWLETGGQPVRATISGRLGHQATGAVDLPVIGDWVMVSSATGTDAVISHILPRKTVLVRRRVGGGPDAQPLAANVDVALIVVGLDREPSLGLIDRAVVMAQGAGIEPVVVLNKTDLCADWSERAREVQAHLPALRVLPVSAQSGDGADVLSAAIGSRRTAVMMGPSGVGKSSLANHLLGTPAMKTGAVRKEDQKGKHTTTHRQLFALPGGALLIDGPGVRELGLWGTAEGVDLSFPDVFASASRCTERDCRHENETGCVVQEDVRGGRLSAERLEDYRKLLDEVARSTDPRRWRRSNRSAQ